MEARAPGISPQGFHDLVAEVARGIAGRPLDADLQDWLNMHYGAHGPYYAALRQACATGVDQGWLCSRENGGIRWGRVHEASEALGGFSVDVVQMDRVAGPHHTHPLGEVDLIMPLDEGALFDGHGAGWCVYGPGSAHSPTVSEGAARVLYLLPQGQIQFTRRAA
jgi:hypothetical protein